MSGLGDSDDGHNQGGGRAGDERGREEGMDGKGYAREEEMGQPGPREGG